MFAVVEFSSEQGGGLAIVRKNWITPRRREVFWPPYKEQKKFNRSLTNDCEEINSETWKLYDIERIFYETDDYEKAKEKLKRAEFSSDIQTEQEEENVGTRRKRVRPVRYSSDSETDEESRKLPPPPPIKKSLLKGAAPGTATTICNTPSSSQSPLQSPQLSLSEKSGFQVLLEGIIEIKNQNKLILAHLSALTEKEKPNSLPEKVPVKFPLKKQDDIEALETFLKEQRNLNSLVSYYSGLGGHNIVSRTNKILKSTLDDVLTSQFNYFGRNNKKAFKELKLCNSVIDAVKHSCECTSVEVESAIKTWLKHAPQRLKPKI